MKFTLLDLQLAEAAIEESIKSADLIGAQRAARYRDEVVDSLRADGVDISAAKSRSMHRRLAEGMTEVVMHTDPEDLA